VRYLRPDKALRLPSGGRGFMGQRRPTSLPSPEGSCRLITIPLENVSRSFDYSDRVTGYPEVICGPEVRFWEVTVQGCGGSPEVTSTVSTQLVGSIHADGSIQGPGLHHAYHRV